MWMTSKLSQLPWVTVQLICEKYIVDLLVCVCALQFCCFTPSTSVISVAQPIRVEISHKVDLNKQLFQVSIIDLEKKKIKYKSQS